MFLIIVLLLFLSTRLTGASCPEKCVCFRSRSVSCKNSKLSEIPRNFENAIRKLDFSGNSLTYINSQTFSFFQKLTHLSLNYNDIEGIAQGSFVATPFIQNLNLTHNALVSFERYSFTNLQLLLHLDLSHNQLISVEEAFADLKELSRLNLCNNKLSEITENTFKGLTNLRHLSICHNKIKNIHKHSFASMDKLMYIVLKGNKLGGVEELDFSSNYLSYIDLSECFLSRIPKGLPNSIHYLQLRRNNITHLDRETFADCRFISILVLDDNFISEVAQDSFQGMVYLQQLWLNRNHIEFFNVSLPTHLKRLFLDSNKLTQVPFQSFSNDSHISTLSLAKNQISLLNYDTFKNLKLLKICNLSGNKIKTINSTSFLNALRLSTLDLSRNPFQHFSGACFRSLIQLKKLYLASISSVRPILDATAFQGLEKVEELVLDSSAGLVEAIVNTDELLSCLSGLKVLSMRHCRLSTLRYDFRDFFPNLKQIEITSNSWCCDNKLLWFKEWLDNSEGGLKVLSVSDNKCGSPVKLRAQSVKDVELVTNNDEECHRSSNKHFNNDLDNYEDPSEELPLSRLELELNPNNVNTMLYSLNQLNLFSPFLKDPSTNPTRIFESKPPVVSPSLHHSFLATRAIKVSSSMLSTHKASEGKAIRQKFFNRTGYEEAYVSSTFLLAMFLVIIIIILGVIFTVLILFLVIKEIKKNNKRVASKDAVIKGMATSPRSMTTVCFKKGHDTSHKHVVNYETCMSRLSSVEMRNISNHPRG